MSERERGARVVDAELIDDAGALAVVARASRRSRRGRQARSMTASEMALVLLDNLADVLADVPALDPHDVRTGATLRVHREGNAGG